jgi:hypothetical protein
MLVRIEQKQQKQKVKKMSITAEQIAEHRGIDVKLVRAIIRQTGKENLQDIANHGADSGYSGLTYYSDTVAFFKRNRAEIVELVKNMASELGENPADMVAGFQCLAGRELEREHVYGGFMDGRVKAQNRARLQEYLPSVSRCLYGGRLTEDDTQVANALTWFAAEEVARAYNDLKDE